MLLAHVTHSLDNTHRAWPANTCQSSMAAPEEAPSGGSGRERSHIVYLRDDKI